MKPFPTLTTSPVRNPHCCASLSLPLLSLLDAVLPPPPALTLSIGSGSGLLEALLLRHHPRRRASAGLAPASFLGVEVPAVNVFLPEQNAALVSGTWAVSGHVTEAEGLLFVYPRSVALVARYLERDGEGEKGGGGGGGVEVVVWVGPVADREEYGRVLEEWGVVDAECKVGREDGGHDMLSEGEDVLVYRARR